MDRVERNVLEERHQLLIGVCAERLLNAQRRLLADATPLEAGDHLAHRVVAIFGFLGDHPLEGSLKLLRHVGLDVF